MAALTCRGCIYWKPDEEPTAERQAMYGECRRSAPRLKMDRVADEDHAIWPPTSAGDWCGEYRPGTLPLPFPAVAEY